MGTIEFHDGDVFSTRAQAIGHGVNVKGVMGAGIALQFKRRFPVMFQQYNILCRNEDLHPGETFIYEIPGHSGSHWVYNIASQDLPGANARLEWLESGMRAALNHLANQGIYRMAIPRIGSGIGGLKEEDVTAMLTELLETSPVTLEIWTL